MSANNGIYILRTIGKTNGPDGEMLEWDEYRVREVMAVENIHYDKYAPDPKSLRPNYNGEYHSVNEYMIESDPFYEAHKKYQEAYSKKYHSTDSQVMIRNAREMWNGCEVYYSEAEAMKYAAKLLHETYICEYGISFIEINEVF